MIKIDSRNLFYFIHFTLGDTIKIDKMNIMFVSLTQPHTTETCTPYQVSDIKIYGPRFMKSPSHKP